MTEVIPAPLWVHVLFTVIVLIAVWWWGSWHRSKYPKKHERVENTAASVVERIRVQGGDKWAALEREMDAIAAEAKAKQDALRDEFRRRIGD